MKDEIQVDKVYRKLFFYYYNKIPVYLKFKLYVGDNAKVIWNKGIILDLNKQEQFVILKDDVFGERPILFEDILIESINSARAKT